MLSGSQTPARIESIIESEASPQGWRSKSNSKSSEALIARYFGSVSRSFATMIGRVETLSQQCFLHKRTISANNKEHISSRVDMARNIFAQLRRIGWNKHGVEIERRCLPKVRWYVKEQVGFG